MNTQNQNSYIYSHLKDAAVFFFTVATCSLVLTVAFTFEKSSLVIADITPVLALPTPPATIELAPEPELDLPEVEVALALPEIEITWALPEIEMASAGFETISMVSLAPDNALSHEPIPFHGIIVQVAGRYEVDPHLIRAIILAESGYNPKAKSKKGARGLMQLMPTTAKALGVENIYDPEENIDGGVRYFRSLLDRFDGDVQLALAAYNAGSRHVRNYEGIPPFKATQHYIKKVLKFHEKFKSENKAGSRRLA